MLNQMTVTPWVKSLAIVAAGLLLTGCMAEAIDSTSPESNATSVARYTDVAATFKVDMVASTITGASFTLFNTTTKNTVDADIYYDGENKIASLVPKMPLDRLTTYEATLSETIEASGNADIKEDYVWSFETANSPVQGALNTVQVAALEVQGQYAYYVARLRRMVVVDLSVPEKPSLAAELPIDGPGWGIALKDNYAFVSNGIIQTVDISNPTVPVIVNTLDIDYRRADVDKYVGSNPVTLEGDYLYAGVQNFGLWVIDISNPLAPSLVGQVDAFTSLATESYTPDNIVKRGNYVYAFSEDNETLIYDVSNPLAPELITIYSDHPARKWIFNGDLAYAVNRNWLGVLDLSDPVNPVISQEVLSDVSNSVFYDLVLDGDNLYVSDMIASRIVKYDVSNAEDPVVVSVIGGVNMPRSIGLINSDTLYASGLISGLYSIEKE